MHLYFFLHNNWKICRYYSNQTPTIITDQILHVSTDILTIYVEF